MLLVVKEKCSFIQNEKIQPWAGILNFLNLSKLAWGEPFVSWWLGTELNRRHTDFQSAALPTELPSHL